MDALQEDKSSQTPVPDGIWQLLIDAHCHPTDDPRPWGSVDVLASKLEKARLGQICAMSTSTRDQDFVAELARRLGPEKLRPAFGYHPWFTHTISLESGVDKTKHYQSLFFPPSDEKSSKSSKSASEAKKRNEAQEELDQLLPHLPEPVALEALLATLRQNLQEHPTAILGEVGLDRAFRLPTDPKGWTREPDDDEEGGKCCSSTNDDGDGEEDDDEERERTHALGRRNRPLTSLTPDIDHQAEILKAQVGIAIDLGRSVSLHSVRAGGATVEVLDALCKAYPASNAQGDIKNRGGMSRKQWKRQQKDARFGMVDEGSDEENISTNVPEPRRRSFQDINVDLHSCTLSATMIRQIQQRHPNIYVSFSTAINSRQKNLEEQLRACDPKRLLTESDWHSAEGLSHRTFDMVKLMTQVLGSSLIGAEEAKDLQGDEVRRYERAATVLHENWRRFVND